VGAPRQRTARGLAGAAWLGAFAVIAIALPMTAARASARVTITPLTGTAAAAHDGRWADLTVALTPADAADDAHWFTATAWQGERDGSGGLVIAPLRRTAPGTYVTTKPVPIHGEWKTLLRLQRGRSLTSMAVYLPSDPAVPAKGVRASGTVERPFVRDKSLLQREAIGGSDALQRAAYGVLGALAVCWLAALVWGLRRLEHAAGERRPPAAAPSRARQPSYAG
jgi:hypothetical protein